MSRYFVFLLVSGLIISLNTGASRYENSIPPEVLEEYESEIVSGTRPQVVRITQSMIFGLRDNPSLGGDVNILDFDPKELSSEQIGIIPEWVVDMITYLLDKHLTAKEEKASCPRVYCITLLEYGDINFSATCLRTGKCILQFK